MTPEELAAIRARDRAIVALDFAYPREGVEAVADRRALLKEVDRLTLLVLMDRISTQDNYLDNHAAMLIERARIRAAVEGLERLWANRITSTGMESVSVTAVECVERAAVLAAIDGEAT